MMPRLLIWVRPIPPYTFLTSIWPADVWEIKYPLNLQFSVVTKLSDLDLTLKIAASWLLKCTEVRNAYCMFSVVFPPS